MAIGPAVEAAYADTNLLIALFAGETHPLHEGALTVFRRVAQGALALIITPVVVGELVYVAAAVLGWNRAATAARLAAVLEADGLIVRELAALQRALGLYGRHRRLDFADAYLCGLALEDGPAVVVSFDRDIDVVDDVRRLAS